MDPENPEWLNKAFLTTCLQGENEHAASVTVTQYDVSAGVAPGNNYGSIILRVKVGYKKSDQEKSVSLIVKGPVSNNLLDLIIDLFGMAEYNFYYTYLPKLRDVLKEDITAKPYYTTINSVIVLEDLKEAGFTMADRQKQLDLNHSKQYFTAAAKFHAAGVLIAKQNPELLDSFPGIVEKMTKNGDYSQMEGFMHDIFIGLNCLIKSISKIGLSEYQPYLDTIKEFILLNINSDANMRMMGLKAMLEETKTMFKSFIHGDCWTTNMMFKHDQSGKPVDIRLVDFQGFRYDTVISDLINFTWVSCNNEVLEYHLDELYQIYCETLNSKLAEFNCPERLSFERLKDEMCHNVFLILAVAFVLLPLTQHDEFIDTTKMFTGKVMEEDIMKFYEGEHFFRKFPQVLKFVAKQGVFYQLEKALLQMKQYHAVLNSQ